MSGENESSGSTPPPPNTINKLNDQLDQWERSLGLPPSPSHLPDIARWLNPQRDFLRSLSAEDCGEIALILAQVGFHLQRATNREKATLLLIRERMARFILPRQAELAFKTAEEKWHLAVATNEKLAGDESRRLECQARLTRVEYLAGRVEKMAYYYSELQQTKRKQHG